MLMLKRTKKDKPTKAKTPEVQRWTTNFDISSSASQADYSCSETTAQEKMPNTLLQRELYTQTYCQGEESVRMRCQVAKHWMKYLALMTRGDYVQRICELGLRQLEESY
jgi:hypothetical protein